MVELAAFCRRWALSWALVLAAMTGAVPALAQVQSIDPNAGIETNPAARTVKVETTATSAALQKVLEEAGYPVTTR